MDKKNKHPYPMGKKNRHPFPMDIAKKNDIHPTLVSTLPSGIPLWELESQSALGSKQERKHLRSGQC
jgi:hypothetical protein